MNGSSGSQESNPPKKSKSILSSLFGSLMQFLGWVVFSLTLALIIEWIGMTAIWKDEGSNHAKRTLESDLSYLNKRLLSRTSTVEEKVNETVQHGIEWIDQHSQGFTFTETQSIRKFKESNTLFNLQNAGEDVTPYIAVVPLVAKTFCVRLALLGFSLPAFILFFLIGMVDGLVERDLRRWGGGRESSMVYNLARKSLFRFFISACVIYISLPVSVNPTWLILPFAIAFGLSTRVTFERFKKYF